MERLCDESLPYLFLTRGDTPSYRTLCSVRVEQDDLIERVWVGLFTVAREAGLQRLGHIVIDSTKLRASASPEAVVPSDEYAALRQELAAILAEAADLDAQEEQEGRPGNTRLGKEVPKEQMREIVRRVRKRLAQEKAAAGAKPPGAPGAAPKPGAVPSVPAVSAAAEPVLFDMPPAGAPGGRGGSTRRADRCRRGGGGAGRAGRS